MGNALIFKSKDVTRLAARWNLELGLTVKGGHFYFSAKGSLRKVDWQLIDDVVAISSEKFMRFNRQGDVEVTR
jgi:hypothetical protein